MEQLKTLNIVIINYKTPSLTIDCINSLLDLLNNDHIHVTIVDNDSQDDSTNILEDFIQNKNLSSSVSLIRSASNLGFAGGNNLGIRHVKANYYLLLNSDTLVLPGAIETLLTTAEEQPEYGLYSPRLQWPDGTPQISCFRFHSPFSELIDSACTSVITKLFKRYNVPIDVSEDYSQPQWTSFACVLIRDQVLEDVGLLDEGYFLYYEDGDYCKMAYDRGWFILNNPSSHVIHLRGGSGEVKSNIKLRKRLPRYYYDSRARFFRKAYGPFGPLIANIFWLIGRSISFAREAVGHKSNTTIDKQWHDIWYGCLKFRQGPNR